LEPSTRHAWAAACLLASASLTGPAAAAPPGAPQLDHVILVVMENHSYDQVRTLPYVSTLVRDYTSFSQSYAVTHPSQPNYLALWAASTLGISNDNCPPAGSPYSAANLGSACEAAGVSWKSYCENLPSVGSTVCSTPDGLYYRKHHPSPDFSNLTHTRECPYSQLAADVAAGTLPALAFVAPNMCDDMHDCSTSIGDTWLANNVPAMISAAGPRGLVILTWDEDDSKSSNHILTVFAGAAADPGYVSSQTITHYTVVRTICDVLGLAPFGNASTETTPVDVWSESVTAVEPPHAAEGLGLSRPFPDPFHTTMTATLALPSAREVHAFVVDCAGRRVKSLFAEQRSGTSAIRWDGSRDDGSRASPGLYYLNVRSGRDAQVRAVVLTR